MSLESMALVWAHSEASGSELLALLAIADHDGDGGSWPSMETIAHRARVSREGARKLVRKLETRGEIITDTNGGGGLRTANHMRTNRYEITLVCPPSCDRSARHRERPADAVEADLLAGIGISEPVDNTPPPLGGVPSAGRGAPPPLGGANHPLTTPTGNSQTEPQAVDASARETDDDQPKDDYSNFGNLLYDSKRKFEEALAAKRQRARPPARAAPRTDAEEHRAAELSAQPCPAQAGFNHWFPPSMTECARGCGTTLADDQEAAA